MRLEIAGQLVDVDDSFASLSPADQQKTVNEIAHQIGVQSKTYAQTAADFNAAHPYIANTLGAVPAAIGGAAGALTKDVGALGELVTPTGSAPNQWINQNITQRGSDLEKVSEALSPWGATAGEIGSYIIPYTGGLKAVRGGMALGRAALGGAEALEAVRPITTLGKAAEATAAGGLTGYATTPDAENRTMGAVEGAVGGAAGETVLPYAVGVGKGLVTGALEGTPGQVLSGVLPQGVRDYFTGTPTRMRVGDLPQEVQQALGPAYKPNDMVPQPGGAGQALGQDLYNYITGPRPYLDFAGAHIPGAGWLGDIAGELVPGMGKPIYKIGLEGIRDAFNSNRLQGIMGQGGMPGVAGISEGAVDSVISNLRGKPVAPDTNPISATNSGFSQEINNMANTVNVPTPPNGKEWFDKIRTEVPGLTTQQIKDNAALNHTNELMDYYKGQGIQLDKATAKQMAENNIYARSQEQLKADKAAADAAKAQADAEAAKKQAEFEASPEGKAKIAHDNAVDAAVASDKDFAKFLGENGVLQAKADPSYFQQAQQNYQLQLQQSKSSSDQRAAEILSMIRNRKQNFDALGNPLPGYDKMGNPINEVKPVEPTPQPVATAPTPTPMPTTAPTPVAPTPTWAATKPTPIQTLSKLDAIKAKLQAEIDKGEYIPEPVEPTPPAQVAEQSRKQTINKDVEGYVFVDNMRKLDKGMLGDLEKKYNMKFDYSTLPEPPTGLKGLGEYRDEVRKWARKELMTKGSLEG